MSRALPPRFALRPVLAAVLSLLALAAAAGAQPASLVVDINPAPPDPSASGAIADFYAFAGPELYFDALTSTSGVELWRTDGTPLGTRQVADLCPGLCSSDPKPLYAKGKVVLFSAAIVPDLSIDGSIRLWRTDGTRAGTYPLTPDGLDLVSPPLGVDGNALYVSLCGTDLGGSPPRCDVWRSDGTAPGTWRLGGPAAGGQVLAIQSAGSRIFFVTTDFALAQGNDLWVSDGSAGDARLVAVIPAPFSYPIGPAGDRFLWFRSSGQGAELWASDGTAAGTRQLGSFAPRDDVSAYLAYRRAGGTVYFPADDGVHGVQVWATDGTPAGTRRVTSFAAPQTISAFTLLDSAALGDRLLFQAADAHGVYHLYATGGGASPPVELSAADSHTSSMVVAGGRALFFADDGVHGFELWASDGTAAGTAMVADLCPGSCGSSGLLFPPSVQSDAGAYFVTYGTYGIFQEIWRTDGTAAGTRRLSDFAAGRPVIDHVLGGAAGRFFFVAHDAAHGEELWIADGTPGGTHPVAEIGFGEASSSPERLTAAGGRLFFTACDGAATTVWASAGTAATTSSVGAAAATPGCGADDAFADHDLTPVGGTVYFLHPGASGTELWRTDGTPAGTAPVSGAPGAPAVSDASGLAAFEGSVWFGVETPTSSEIWSADATGARRALSLSPGTFRIESLSAAGPRLLFFAGDSSTLSLFASDGTPAGTARIAGPFSAYDGGFPPPVPRFVAAGGMSFFVAQSVVDSSGELWRTDGTAAGTALVHRLVIYPEVPLVAAGGEVFFFDVPPPPAGSFALWRSDGTPGGTLPLAIFPSPFFDSELAAAGDRVYFTADDGVHGVELWTSDGTSAGTRLVADIAPGPVGSFPHDLAAAGGLLYFGANDIFHGDELWATDGTAAGTRLVQDIAPEAASSSPSFLTVVGDRLYFAADDGLHGRELWSLSLSGGAAPCQPAPDRLCLAGGRFQVTAEWHDFQGGGGQGTAVALTGDTGYFWFFNPANVEVVTKVLDGRGVNQAFWVFYGALSTVEYALTVTDTATGLARRYVNPAGQLASVADTDGFGPLGAHATAKRPPAAALVAARTEPRAASGHCTADAATLCLAGGRFAVTVAWKDFQGRTGQGAAVGLTGDTGYFWFFDPANVELVTKVIDGRAVNSRFWLFYGALSSVEYTLTVADSQTGAVKEYRNPSGRLGSVADTDAF